MGSAENHWCFIRRDPVKPEQLGDANWESIAVSEELKWNETTRHTLKILVGCQFVKMENQQKKKKTTCHFITKFICSLLVIFFNYCFLIRPSHSDGKCFIITVFQPLNDSIHSSVHHLLFEVHRPFGVNLLTSLDLSKDDITFIIYSNIQCHIQCNTDAPGFSAVCPGLKPLAVTENLEPWWWNFTHLLSIRCNRSGFTVALRGGASVVVFNSWQQ